MENFSTYKQFDDTTDVIYDQRELVTAPLWSNSQASLSAIFTSSFQNSIQKEYYYEVYNSQSNAYGAQPQFSIAYADLMGSGSGTGSLEVDLLIRPTKTNYLQYRQLLLPIGISNFTFMDGMTTEQSSDYVYVINVNRSRFKDRIDTGNWQLSLASLNHLGEVNPTASIITLIDDSGGATSELTAQGGRVLQIRSGSITNGVKTDDTTPYGLFFPDNGVIVLNGIALDASSSLGTLRNPATASITGSTGVIGDDNAYRLFTSISGAMERNKTLYSFEGRTSEVISSTYYFSRLRWNEFNWTNNPSFFNQSSSNYGYLKHKRMEVEGPQVYPTTVGLYDNNENLLAVAKMSKAIKKTFDHEMIIKIKLDY